MGTQVTAVRVDSRGYDRQAERQEPCERTGGGAYEDGEAGDRATGDAGRATRGLGQVTPGLRQDRRGRFRRGDREPLRGQVAVRREHEWIAVAGYTKDGPQRPQRDHGDVRQSSGAALIRTPDTRCMGRRRVAHLASREHRC